MSAARRLDPIDPTLSLLIGTVFAVAWLISEVFGQLVKSEPTVPTCYVQRHGSVVSCASRTGWSTP